MKLNAAQMEAVLDTAHSKTGLTGIQGPPGTGKTYTVTNDSVDLALNKERPEVLRVSLCRVDDESSIFLGSHHSSERLQPFDLLQPRRTSHFIRTTL